MAPQSMIGGRLKVKVNGDLVYVKGSFTYNLGRDKRDPIVGHDGVHGMKSLPQAPYFEGPVTFHSEMSLTDFLDLTDVTATLELNNGKTLAFYKATQTGDGQGTSEENEINCRFDALSAEEI